MKTPKKGEKGVTGMDCRGQSIQKRKRKQANNENNPSLATGQNQKSRLGLVLEDVTNRPNIEGFSFIHLLLSIYNHIFYINITYSSFLTSFIFCRQ